MTVTLYRAPATIAEAQALLTEQGPEAKVLAGGTDLLVQMRARLVSPRVIVDVKRLPFRYIRSADGELRIGALATHTDLAREARVRSTHAGLAAAARTVGGPALRNRGTVGGNVVNASPAADTVPPLIAADAQVRLAGPDGQRELPLDQLLTGYRQTALRSGELITEIRLPAPGRCAFSGFVKPGNRRAMIIATISIACHLEVDPSGRITVARLAYGSVGPTVLRVPEAERALVGAPLDGLEMAAASVAAAEVVTPISDLRSGAEHRIRLVEVHTRRLLEVARDELMRRLEQG